jgi:hypothetical protein
VSARGVPPGDARAPSRVEFALLGCVVAGAVAWWIRFRLATGIVLEDALITFRFAENLAQGHGFAFNPGEPVLGTTTPLLTLVLAGLGAPFGVEHIPALANAVLMLAGAAALVCLHLAARRSGLGAAPAFLATVLVAFHADVVWSAAGGMETPLLLAGIAASLLAAATGRMVATGVVLGLCVLTRIDAVCWAVALAAAVGWRRPAGLARIAASAAAVLLPWAAYSLVAFGTLVPNTVTAKRTVVHLGDVSLPRHVVEHLSWFSAGLGVRATGGPFEALVLGVLVCLVLFGVVASVTRRDRAFLLPLALFPALLCGVYLVGDAPHEFAWYLVPVTFCALPLAAAGVFELGRAVRLRADSTDAPSLLGIAVAALVLEPVLLNVFVGNAHALKNHARYQRIENGLRRAVGEWLAANTPPDASVAMEAIGYQGTFARRRVIDLAGLVSPDVVRIRARSADPAAAFSLVLRELRPDYLVLRSFEADRNESFFGGPLNATDAERAEFARYHEVARFSAPAADAAQWGELGDLTIFRRE